eukprot:TRINITY_DN713_c0_g1_i1.p1 TRINITY_DN713_c0_g1~~TRINITY_DN713_c0_g1_i1.p1  ORF type:complete len:313 (+),score=52.62 TRINITY_DN713_c0_g1_i1:810-1748(+)
MLAGKSLSFNAVKWLLFMFIVLQNILVSLITISFSHDDLCPRAQLDGKDQNKPINEAAISDPSFISKEDSKTSLMQNSSPDIEEEKASNVILYSLKFVWIRLCYIYGNKILLHTLLHALTMYLLYNLVEYPLTLEENKPDMSHATLDDFCSGYLKNLLLQGSILNGSFFIASSLYGLFLVKCKPFLYYKYVFPLLGLFLGLVISSLFVEPLSSNGIFKKIVISVGQVMPYYFNAFDFFMFTSATIQTYFGFLSALYGLGFQVIYGVTGYAMGGRIPNDIIIYICLGILVISVIHSVFFAMVYGKTLQQASSS